MKRNKLPLMKKVVGAMLLGMLSFGAKAQTAANYVFQASSGTYTNLASGSTMSIIGDDLMDATAHNIGFTFNFCGTNYTQFRANSNGWITFGTGTTATPDMYTNATANLGSISPAIMPFWEDQNGSAATALYTTTGTTPNQICTIEFRNMRCTWNGPVTISYQIILHETSNVIDIIYRQEPNSPTGDGATIGIASSGMDYLVLNNSSTAPTASSTVFTDNITTRPATGQVYTFSPPPACSGTPSAGVATTTITNFTTCTATPVLNFTGGGTETGYTYQWQSSPHNQNNWTNIGGVLTNPNNFSAPSISDTTDYQLITTCTNSTLTNTSSVVTVSVAKPMTTPATSTVCLTNGQPLTVSIPLSGASTVFAENFNGGTGGFTFVNTSTGNTPAAADWTQRPSGYATPGFSSETLVSPTATDFMLTNSDAVGSGANVHTEMISPVINTNGYQALNISFVHYLKGISGQTGMLEVTTDGTNWTLVPGATYSGTADIGSATSFVSQSYDLSSYIGQSNFQFRFVYDAGWDYWWAIDDIMLSGVPTQTVVWSASSGNAGLPSGATTPSIANANITVTPTATGTFTYTATTSGCGAAPAVTVDVVPAPTAAFAMSNMSVCENNSATVMMTGEPFGYATVDDGTSTFNVLFDGGGNGSFNTGSLAAGTYTYTLVSVTGTMCTVNATGSVTVEATPRPTGMLTTVNPNPICHGATSYVSVANIVSNTWPATIYYSNGSTSGSYATSFSSDNIPVIPAAGSYVYVIDSIVDAQGCASLPGNTPGSAPLVVNPTPTATITSSADTVCPGTLVTFSVNLTGTGPWDFTYSDGTNSTNVTAQSTSPFDFDVTVSADTTFMLTSLTDASGCPTALPGEFDVPKTVTIGAPAAITMDPSDYGPICTGEMAMFSATADGFNLSYQWLENNMPLTNSTIYAGVNSPNLTINNSGNLGGNVYSLEVTGQCGIPDTSATAVLNVNTGNTWNGAVSSDWSNGNNWSCGTIPVVTTDVIIPNNMPFDPIVDITTAIGNTLTIDPGASVSFNLGQALELKSTITNNGTFDASNGHLILSGAGAQNIPGGTYMELTVDGGGAKTLDANAMVDNMLTLTDGNIVLNGFNLTLAAPQSTMGGGVNSFIMTNGTGVVWGLGMDAADSVTFHVGNSTYNPLGFRNNGTMDDFSVRVLDAVYEDGVGTNSTMVSFPVVNRTWLISEASAGGSEVTMSPYWTPTETINGFDPNYTYGAHHDGTMWEAMIDSTSTGTAATFAFGSHVFTTMDSVWDFSPFTVASGTQYPLSVKLSDIAAANFGSRNKVNWTSSAETVGAKYELQRSVDGKTFAAIATVNAKGEASAYTYWDETPATGVNYYRIKLMDMEGHYAFSKVVSATVNVTGAFNVQAYPNPVSSVVTVKVNGDMSANSAVEVTDVTGKVIKTVKMESDKLNINMGDVASGVYFIKYSDDMHQESIKINKQ